jgi:hypothetical protein
MTMPLANWFWGPVAVAWLTMAGAGRAAEPDVELADAVQTLQQARLGTDGPALLDFFKKRTLSEADQAKLAGIVRQLGDPSFRVRQQADKDLLVAGRAARPFLRAALTDPDLEIVRRAERLLSRLDSKTDVVLMAAAARVLADRKPDGAVEVLLGYLPLADDEYLQEALFQALAKAGVKDGKASPALVKALTDREAVRRAAAAFVVGRAKTADLQAVRALLGDTDAHVRFQAATALVETGDKAGVETLIGLVGEGPAELAWQAEDLLYRVAGEQAPASLTGGEGTDRRKCRAAWTAWWKDHADKVDLARLTTGEALLGRTLIAEVDGAGQNNQGRLSELGANRKTRWEINSGLGQPVDIQNLPGGRLLVGEYSGNKVTERDRHGKVLWEHKCNTTVIACQRLPNGHTFITTTAEMFEVDRAGKTVFNWKRTGAIYFATKLRNGHVLYGDGGNQVFELDATGKQIWSLNLAGAAWGSIEKLPSGRYLVCLYGAGKVVEVDKGGKIYWERQIPSPTLATRLRNGHTLVGADRMVVEYNAAGKEIWKHTTQGRVWRVRRY